MILHTVLVIGHVVGTILGVGGATLAEIQIVKALKDHKVDASERALLHANYMMIRVGLAIVVLSGVFLVWLYLLQGENWVIKDSKIWFKELLVLFIIANAVFLTKHWVPLWLGSAISFTSWWMATVLGLWRDVPYSFLELLFGYVIIVFVVAVILRVIRRRYVSF